MKISTASKKVLASALSAAMVVAFAPTVAFGAETAALTEDQAKALGYTVKSVQIVNGNSGSEVKTFYYKDLQEAFDSGVVYCATPGGGSHTSHVASKADSVNAAQLGLTLMADQDGEFVTNDGVVAAKSNTGAIIPGVADTISIETAGFKITNSKDESKAPLTVSAGDTVTVTGTGTIEQVKADAADGAPARVSAIAGAGNVVLKGVTVTTASKKTEAVNITGTTKLEGASIAGKVLGVTEIKGGTYGAIAGANIDVYGTVTTGAITGNVDVQSGADLTVTVQNTKNGEELVGISNGVDFETIASNKTSKVSVSVINNGSTVAGEMKKVATHTYDAGDTYYKLNSGKYIAYNTIDSQVKLNTAIASAEGVYLFTAGKDATAVGISGAVTGLAKNATLEVTAKANGYDADKALANVYQSDGTTADAADIDPVTDATAIGSVGAAVADGALTATAVSIDGIAKGIAAGLTVTGGTIAVSAEGYDATKSIAIDGNLAASTGKYTGKYSVLTDGDLTGGSYSVKPALDQYDEAKYVIADDGEFFTVEQAKNFTVNTTAAYDKLITAGSDTDVAIKGTCVENILQDLSAGKPAIGLVLADGVKTADILAKAVDGKLYVNFTKVGYNAKRATDEQKAAYEAMKAYAAENLSLIEDAALGTTTVEFYELSIGYLEKDGTYTKMAGINDLGTKVDGRNTVANAIQLRAVRAYTDGEILSYSGSVAKMPYAVKDGKTQNYVETAAIPFATALMSTDEAALKDAVVKGEEQAPAVEKATQGIDVAQKSKTVKLAKGKTKTQKAITFAMGASAETGLTVTKKSGSSRITVKGQKVTLKKGTKKGTFTAKVSIKAAASDEYLAAAKTITVKFVVKK